MSACYISWPSPFRSKNTANFRETSQFAIEVQPLFIRNSFELLFFGLLALGHREGSGKHAFPRQMLFEWRSERNSICIVF
jgi:hypothetical protein